MGLSDRSIQHNVLPIFAVLLSISTALQWAENTVDTGYMSRKFTFIGSHNKSLFILGGWRIGGDVFIEYNTTSQSYSTHANAVTFGYQFGQSSTQNETILYMLPYRTGVILSFNLKSLVLVEKIKGYLGTSASLGSCLTYFNDYLLVIGGFDYPDIYYPNTYIYDVVTKTWSNGPSLPSGRFYHSCNTVGNAIYVIAGSNGTIPSNDVLTLTMNDSTICCEGTWIRMNETLTSRRHQHHSVVHKTKIYIIGGRNETLGVLDEVDVINTETGSIQLNSYLIRPQYGVSAAVLSETIYSFNGMNPNQAMGTNIFLDTWAYFQYALLTQSPTCSPSNAPTYSPSNVPTLPPSNAPTYSPSNAPSNSPTRFPISINEYNQQFEVFYYICNLFQYNVDRLSLHMITSDIVPIIETSYVNAANENAQTLQYREFHIIVNDFDFFKANPKDGNNYTLKVNSSVLYADDSVRILIEFVSYKAEFINHVDVALRSYFDHETVQFYAEILSVFIYNASNDEEIAFHYVFYSLLIFMSLMCLGSIAALLFNKKDGTKIDDSAWTALISAGLHIFDFVSDINLTTEMVSHFGNDDGMGSKQLLYTAGFGSILFLILPYLVNIVITLNIERFVSGNISASMHFKQHRGVFVLLVLCTGSAYCALTLFSSRLFGLELFNSGLTKYELQQLSGLNLFGSVLLENCAQLALQIVYVVYRQGALSQNTILSFTASFISVVAAVMSYLLQRSSSNCSVVQYQLEIVKGRLSDDDKTAIAQKKECKKELSTSLAATLNVEASVLELGFVKMSNVGFVVNVIHYVFKDDLDEDEPVNAVLKLYEGKKEEVNETFSAHFHFGSDVKVNIKLKMNKDIELHETQNLISLAYKIDALFKANMAIECVQKQLIKEGHNQELIISVLSTYYSDGHRKEHESLDSDVIQHKIGDHYVLMSD
eukprot:203852_1